jgi:hypothetical protein
MLEVSERISNGAEMTRRHEDDEFHGGGGDGPRGDEMVAAGLGIVALYLVAHGWSVQDFASLLQILALLRGMAKR